VRDFPDSAVNDNARLFLAELNLAEGKNDEAERALRDLQADPKADAEVREDSLARLVALAGERQDWPRARELSSRFLNEFAAGRERHLVRLHLASAQLGLKQPAEAEKTLASLKSELGSAAGQTDWAPRVWILLAEAFHQQKNYGQVEATVDELRARFPKSPLLYQADEILGRSYKNQAQWDKALAAFQRVIDDRQEEQNETAAKSQLMIAEIHFLRKQFEEAKTAYLKVYTLYDKFPDWQAPALFQVGRCEEQLAQQDKAEKTYALLIERFPNSDFARQAQKRADELRQRPPG
jgi:TolA-binding protein